MNGPTWKVFLNLLVLVGFVLGGAPRLCQGDGHGHGCVAASCACIAACSCHTDHRAGGGGARLHCGREDALPKPALAFARQQAPQADHFAPPAHRWVSVVARGGVTPRLGEAQPARPPGRLVAPRGDPAPAIRPPWRSA